MVITLEPEKEADDARKLMLQPVPPLSKAGDHASPRAFPIGLCLFLAVLALRLWALLKLTDSQFLLPNSGDMLFYNDWALRILRGNWTDHVAFYGLPLYAYLLAGIYKVCGYSPFVPGLLQAGCDAATALLLYKISVVVFGDSSGGAFATAARRSKLVQRRGIFVGILAALGWGFFVPAQAYSIILMPTAWLVCAFWFVVWQIVSRERAPAGWALLLLGALMGFVAMGVATILFLVPLVLTALVWRWQGSPAQRAIGAALLIAGVFLGVSPAWTHNYFVARDPVILSAHSGVNFWIGNNPVATGYPKFPPGLHAGQEAMLKDSITTAEKAAGHPLKRSEVSAYWSRQARAWITAHPTAWLKLVGTKTRNFWSAFRYDDISVLTALRDQSIVLPGLGFGLVAALGLPGLLMAGWKFRSSRWIAAAILLHMASLLTVFVTERYRLAVVPGLLIFAAFAIWELWQSLARSQYRLAGLLVLLLGGSTAFVSMPQGDPTLWALDSYNSGLQALDAQQLSVAQQKLDLAYAYSPHNAEVNFAEGNLHLALGDIGRAKNFYAATLALDPKHDGALNNLGVVALEEERWEIAGKLFRRALRHQPRNAKTHYLLARALFNAGQLEEASGEVGLALTLQPTQEEFQKLRDEIQARLASQPRS